MYRHTHKPKTYPLDLAAHMAECEANYARLMKLLPNMAQDDHRKFAIAVHDSRPLQFRVTVSERCKYTTMLEVVQVVEENKSWMSAPDFSLRVYHDARMAEVIRFNEHARLLPNYHYPNQHMFHRDEKIQWNKFLGEWLSHCLQFGQIIEHPALCVDG